MCINERNVVIKSKSMYNTKGHNPMAEGVRVDISKRYGLFAIVTHNVYDTLPFRPHTGKQR